VSIAEILENELKAALDVKDERSLHNYITILTENLVRKDEYMSDSGTIHNDIKLMVELMREESRRRDEQFKAMDRRFEAIDKRFEAIDKRFEAINKRFDDLMHSMDKRFEASDKRFDDLIGQMNSRFNMMFYFMSAGFTILTVRMTPYRVIG